MACLHVRRVGNSMYPVSKGSKGGELQYSIFVKFPLHGDLLLYNPSLKGGNTEIEFSSRCDKYI